MILMVIIRYISRVLVWIVTILVILGSLGGTGVLWWLYAKQRKSPKETVIPEQLQIAEDNLRALLIYAISATVFTVSMGLGGSFRFTFLFTGIINGAETHL